jgi:hypothetical protein
LALLLYLLLVVSARPEKAGLFRISAATETMRVKSRALVYYTDLSHDLSTVLKPFHTNFAADAIQKRVKRLFQALKQQQTAFCTDKINETTVFPYRLLNSDANKIRENYK